MTKNEDTRARVEAQSQVLAERLSIAAGAAADATKLVVELRRLINQPGDNEREAIQEILPRLLALTRLSMMAGHPDATLEHLKASRAASCR
ncbi:hypothetical protein QTH90_30085 [Variovorax sp. J2P1-59]|uniref:hypothetical protein n=1 Tax=Variovorax flavidus TaxID=3053501 RepID=UPI002575AA6A|nr:hypothetical protein [Variovorax sp. J2P1-59]MDM0078691.1 hypothetical protein [Variovorax sp. J2P1-59]